MHRTDDELKSSFSGVAMNSIDRAKYGSRYTHVSASGTGRHSVLLKVVFS